MTRTGSAVRRVAPMLLIALSCLCWGGCAGGAGKVIPPSRLQAIAHNQRGIQAQAGGRTDAALAEFSEALRLHSSIEHTDGMIITLINIARTQRLKGDLAAAGEAIERAATLLREPSDLAAELFFEKAKILLAAGNLPAAREWALRAGAAERGGAAGRAANLVAAISLRQVFLAEAREHAERALRLNTAEELAGERANSLRLLGEIHLAKGNSDKAGESYSEALQLDKELGLGRKIAADLRGLAGVARKKNDIEGAAAYDRRALTVKGER